MLHPSVTLIDNSRINGKGLVAKNKISKGEIIWQPNDDEPVLHWSQAQEWSEDEREEFIKYAIQIGDNEYILTETIARFINHSCEPNMWWGNNRTLIASRDIYPGEEITYDYSTSDTLIDYRMPCNCGSNKCRLIISNKDHLDPSWQKRYKHHLPDHVKKAILASRKKLSH